MKLEMDAKELSFLLDCCDEVIDEYETDGSCRDVDSAVTLKAKLFEIANQQIPEMP